MHAMCRRPFPLAAGVALALAASACGATADHRPQGTSSSSSSGGRSSSGGTSGGTSGGSGGASSSGASSSGSSGAASSSSGGKQCAGSSTRAQRQALDIYLMLDRSGSMGYPTGDGSSTKWQAITAALSSFFAQPLQETSVGLQYFGLGGAACDAAKTCSTNADCGYCGGKCSRLLQTCVATDPGASSCSAADYAKPEVEIGAIAQTGPLITASMSSQTPASDTPTSAALQGAVDHARAWASDPAHAGHAVLVVFATDGEPSWCDMNLDHIDAIAASGLSSSPSIRTFVIGVGDLQANLDGIAKAGGTGAAYIVDTGASVTDQFLKALNDIRGKTVGCSYAIPAPPAGQKADYGLVNVTYTPGSGGAAITLGKVASAGACGTSDRAWHYDDEVTHGSIVLCPSTCALVQADTAARVDIVLGCQTSGEF